MDEVRSAIWRPDGFRTAIIAHDYEQAAVKKA